MLERKFSKLKHKSIIACKCGNVYFAQMLFDGKHFIQTEFCEKCNQTGDA